jgi:hypothetical protein
MILSGGVSDDEHKLTGTYHAVSFARKLLKEYCVALKSLRVTTK